MATMSAARIRSLYRRYNHAYEAVYHFSANPVRQVVYHQRRNTSEHGNAIHVRERRAGNLQSVEDVIAVGAKSEVLNLAVGRGHNLSVAVGRQMAHPEAVTPRTGFL